MNLEYPIIQPKYDFHFVFLGIADLRAKLEIVESVIFGILGKSGLISSRFENI